MATTGLTGSMMACSSARVRGTAAGMDIRGDGATASATTAGTAIATGIVDGTVAGTMTDGVAVTATDGIAAAMVTVRDIMAALMAARTLADARITTAGADTMAIALSQETASAETTATIMARPGMRLDGMTASITRGTLAA